MMKESLMTSYWRRAGRLMTALPLLLAGARGLDSDGAWLRGQYQ
jgi:hypothetical protein